LSILVAIARDDPVSHDDAVAAWSRRGQYLRDADTDVLVYLEKPGLGAWHLDRLPMKKRPLSLCGWPFSSAS
jgi:hypothetical protein